MTIDGVRLCIETFGSPSHPAVLLVAGGAQSMVWWEDEFCARLAGGGRYVVRYDHRDTGRSIASPAGSPDYTSTDLATDPLRVLDGLGVDQAHVVGMSMGGGIAMYLAAEHGDRVRSLVLVESSAAGPGSVENGLPPMAPAVAASFTDPDPEPDWSDRDAVVDYRVAVERPYAGGLGFDEPRVRRLAALEVDRTTDMAASLTNHFVIADDGSDHLRLGEITTPTLVLHGTTDPLFPLGHGEALAREIPGARLVPLEGAGHEIPPPPLWDLTIATMLEHTAIRALRSPFTDSRPFG
ncbi:alpha/beta fold hydrolase [Pseudonocardia sp. MH-G8]|uniref:alpha/beta fold hydrolase n=1 Tax=Pseudonocardia sp. MH-G8 TaxID=1854588 RepID=UPI001E5FFB1D|nr:alpha/beta fold hydrolase [Pseudonocardia sp. MH-G8]